MSDFVYDKAKLKLLDGTILPAHTFKLILLTPTHSSSKSTHEFLADVSGDEITGSGYSRTTLTVTLTRSLTVVKFDATDFSFAALTPQFRYGVIYDDSETNDPLVCFLDFGSTQTPNGAPVDITFNASGIFTLTDA